MVNLFKRISLIIPLNMTFFTISKVFSIYGLSSLLLVPNSI